MNATKVKFFLGYMVTRLEWLERLGRLEWLCILKFEF